MRTSFKISLYSNVISGLNRKPINQGITNVNHRFPAFAGMTIVGKEDSQSNNFIFNSTNSWDCFAVPYGNDAESILIFTNINPQPCV